MRLWVNQQGIYTLFKQTSQWNSLVSQEQFPIALGCICFRHISNTECSKLFGILCLDICSSICLCIQGNQPGALFCKLVLHLNTAEARKNSTAVLPQSQENCTRLRTSALKKEAKENSQHFGKGVSQNSESVAANTIVQTLLQVLVCYPCNGAEAPKDQG